MSDLQTVIEAVKAATSRRTAQDTFHIQRALEGAIRHYKRKKFFFNGGSGTALMEADGIVRPYRLQLWLIDSNTDPPTETLVEDPFSGTVPPAGPGETYETRTAGYPQDFLRAISVRYETQWPPLRHLSLSTFRAERQGTFRSTIRGPRIWTRNPDQTIEIFPIGDEGGQLHMDYVADIGSPELAWDGEKWVFTIRGDTVEDTYSNAWLVDGQNLIVNRMLYTLNLTTYDSPQDAQLAKALELEAYEALRTDYEDQEEPSEAVPFWPRYL